MAESYTSEPSSMEGSSCDPWAEMESSMEMSQEPLIRENSRHCYIFCTARDEEYRRGFIEGLLVAGFLLVLVTILFRWGLFDPLIQWMEVMRGR